MGHALRESKVLGVKPMLSISARDRDTHCETAYYMRGSTCCAKLRHIPHHPPGKVGVGRPIIARSSFCDTPLAF